MQSYIARQPILDRNLNLYGYELLYRNDQTQNFFEESNQDLASSNTIMESFHMMGIEKMTGGKPAFVNFTPNLIEQGVATLFPKEYLVIELLETIQPTVEIVQACKKMKGLGYRLALDDFVYSDGFSPLIDICDIIKVDFLLSPIEAIWQLAASLKNRNIALLAEKIETAEMFEQAKAMGFSYFQGYFFSRPSIVSNRRADPLKINYLHLLRMVNRRDFDFAAAAEIVRRDVALSYRLLRLVNSVYFGPRNRISDIKQALVMLGTDEVRKWISLLAMSSLASDKPDELVKMSLIRARFMELCARPYAARIRREELFLIGLFSLIDAMVDRPLDEVLGEIALPAPVRSALLEGEGRGAKLISLIRSFEQGDWENTILFAKQARVSPNDVSRIYFEAAHWCMELTEPGIVPF